MNRDFHNFLFVWLDASWPHVQERIREDKDMKDFLNDAWDAYIQRPQTESAVAFGREWRPHPPAQNQQPVNDQA